MNLLYSILFIFGTIGILFYVNLIIIISFFAICEVINNKLSNLLLLIEIPILLTIILIVTDKLINLSDYLKGILL